MRFTRAQALFFFSPEQSMPDAHCWSNGHQRETHFISHRSCSMMNIFFLCEQKLQLLLLFHFQFIWFKTLNFFLPNSSRQLRDSRTTRGGKEECLAWNGKTDEREDEEANGVKKFHWMVQMMRVITLIEFLNEVSTRQRERRLLLLHIFIMMRKIHAFWCILPIALAASSLASRRTVVSR